MFAFVYGAHNTFTGWLADWVSISSDLISNIDQTTKQTVCIFIVIHFCRAKKKKKKINNNNKSGPLNAGTESVAKPVRKTFFFFFVVLLLSFVWNVATGGERITTNFYRYCFLFMRYDIIFEPAYRYNVISSTKQRISWLLSLLYHRSMSPCVSECACVDHFSLHIHSFLRAVPFSYLEPSQAKPKQDWKKISIPL